MRKVESTRVSHHGYAGTPGIPARNGFNGFLRDLPGDRAFLSPSPPRSLLLKNLTPASRRQDHTTSPSASGALVFCTLRVHCIPPRVRDDRDTPLEWDETMRIIKVILLLRKIRIFLQKGLDRQISLTTLPVHPTRGAYRDRHGRGVGCGGRGGCAGRARRMRTVKSCGPDASTPASSSRSKLRGRW